MKFYILSSIIFVIIFLYFPASDIRWMTYFQPVWIWNKEGGYGTKNLEGRENPLSTLSGYKVKGGFYSFPAKSFFRFGEDRLLEYSVLDEGFYEYKKLGDEVSYYNGWNELFWKKPYSSYPRPGYFSSVIPLVSGDGNTVFFADRNGNLSGIKSVDGRFATDICYSTKEEMTLVVFSGGEYFLLDKNANALQSYEPDETEFHKESFFAKSCSISPNGKTFAIHFQLGGIDRIRIYLPNRKKSEWSLDKVYPQKIHFAINDEGIAIFALPGKVSIRDYKGKILSEWDADTDLYYNPIYVHNEYFLWGNKTGWEARDKDGHITSFTKIRSNEYPFRFFPGRSMDSFYIESKEELKQILVNDYQ